MDSTLKTMIWQQFGAAIDMLDDVLMLCPDHLWTTVVYDDPDDGRYGQFWYVATHTLLWLDITLGGSFDGFKPPTPFVRGKFPDQPYTKEQVRGYLQQCRQKCKATIEALTDEAAYRICTFDWMAPTFLELQLYTMRHVQEHTAQLSLVLGQNGVEGMDWVVEARDKTS